MTDSVSLAFLLDKEQYRLFRNTRLWKFSIEGEESDVEERNARISANTVYRISLTAKHLSPNVIEALLIAEPVDLKREHFRSRDTSQAIPKTYGRFWLTPNWLLTPDQFRRTDGTVDRDTIFMAIAFDKLYVDLEDALLTEPSKVKVFPNQDAAIAFSNLLQTPAQDSSRMLSIVNYSAGSVIQWDGKGWIVVNLGERMIGLLDEDKTFAEIPISAFEKLVKEGRITGVTNEPSSNLHPEAKERIEQADKKDYQEANRKYEIVRAYLNGESSPTNTIISERTLRDWSAKYRKALEAYGNGYVGLLPCKRTGNTKNKLSAPSRELIKEFIENDYETLKQKSKFAVYALYRLACERRAIIPASYKTFCKVVKQQPRYKQTLKRQGRKAAYAEKEFCWNLTPTTPRHGEWPMHIAHIDHTELDAELVCSLTGQNFGRAWATFLTDAFSRRLAVYVTYDPPSYRSCMMILRECVRRFGRLPQTVVVDGGRDFSSTYFDTVLARYECTKKTRPPAEGRFGSVGEKPFDTNNTQFIHNLQGNTKAF